MPPSPVPALKLPDSPVSLRSSPPSAPLPGSCAGDSVNPSATSEGVPITFDPLPKQSVRTALILDRFSANCPIVYCSNDSFLSTTVVMGRSFFDFVTKKDESLVRSWIDAVKGWGVNERGQPSDGGFGFGKFHLFVQGRDSRCIVPSHFALKIAHVCSATDILNLRHHETAIVQHITQRREDILELHHLRPADPVFEIHGRL